MPDYGHEIKFGYFLVPEAGDPEGVLETARVADRLGYDLLGVQDHPYQPGHLDTLALLGVILGQTERIRVFQDVGNLPLRPPAVFAKAAATLDALSGGRFEAGLGGGAFLQAAEAMGAPPLTARESLEALEEAVWIMRAFWSDAPSVRFDGRHYRLRDARPGPVPAHEIGIWLGAAKPLALALTGRVADGWAAPLMSSYMPPAAAAEAQTTVDRAAREAGRDPSGIRRIYNVPARSPRRRRRRRATPTRRSSVRPTIGRRSSRTSRWTSGSARSSSSRRPKPDTLRTFIEDVAPQVRARVETARAGERPSVG